jgi:threonine dehydratase
MITREQIVEAQGLVSGHIRETPLLRLSLSGESTPPIALKLEQLQVTGSFKPRGVFCRVLSNKASESGLIAASGGNAGLAVAYAAQKLAIPAEIFVPESIAPAKLRGLKALNATVTVVGTKYADAYLASVDRAAESGALIIHAYDQREVAIGQGTLALEIEHQFPEVNTILVSVGGGGLYAGVASWFVKVAKVVPVEPEHCPTLASAIATGGPLDVDVAGVAQSSLGATRICQRAYDIAVANEAETILVSDEAILDARRQLWRDARLAGEPAGVTALAAITSGAYIPRPDEKVCVVISGANSGTEGLEAR